MNYNIALLLTAGTSSRFISNDGKPKQLYKLNDIPIIMYSIRTLLNINEIYEIIIITNSICTEEISELIRYYSRVTLLINNVNDRLDSIGIGLDYIKNKYNRIKNIIIHDVARPFVPQAYFEELLDSCKSYLYSQYYLKLTNGLAKYDEEKNNIIMMDRDKYIEICTPLAANFDLYYYIFMIYISKPNRVAYEHYDIMNAMNIKYNLILGSNNHLRKITTIDDIF